MNLSQNAQVIYTQIQNASALLGDLRKMAKEIKTDHKLAMELWDTRAFKARLFAILVMDKKELNQEFIDMLVKDMQIHEIEERNQLMDWLMANQLTKDKKTIALIESWADSSSSLQRRIYWYYQARQRWTGQKPPDNTSSLLDEIEDKIISEEPEVQWAMNFTAAWIGVFDPPYRDRCILLGKKTGLYKNQMVSKGCTPDYLPEFIRIEVGKRSGK